MAKLAALALSALMIAGPAAAADALHPTVVELFQSQGCSSCPPANANLVANAGRSDLLALSFAVTYWDHLGWKDTFGNPRFTDRQWAYARALGHDNVATPQVVVNGRIDGIGARPQDFDRLVRAGDRGTGGPSLEVADGAVRIGPGKAPALGADVWLVRYDPRVVQVGIRAGENTGKTLPHRNVVKELVRVGAWRGAPTTLKLPPARDPALKTAVLVQVNKGGAILAAARG